MTVAGSISKAEENLRTTLADGTTFRTWVGAADQAEALAKIYCDGLPAPANNADTYTRSELEDYRPYAVIFTSEKLGFRKQLDSYGVDYQFAESGRLVLRLYQTCPAQLDDQPTSEANREFKNTIGQCIDDMCALAGKAVSPDNGSYLAFHTIQLEEGPYWPHPDMIEAQGMWQGADLSVEW